MNILDDGEGSHESYCRPPAVDGQALHMKTQAKNITVRYNIQIISITCLKNAGTPQLHLHNSKCGTWAEYSLTNTAHL